jgi:hypothetical protein
MLGRYRVLAELGSGGMGVVYAAEDTVLQRRVAIKTLPFLHAATAADRERLIGEARAAARISHPHVVTIHDVESAGEIDFLVMELLPLGSLGQRLAERGPLPWRLATRLVAQACAGLAAAHAAGIVHRDIKPSNLLIVSGTSAWQEDAGWPNDDSLAVKIADFGISRLAIPQRSASGPIVAAGTVHYMSPEQCEGDAEPRSDLYSLGATFYTLLTGSPPFVAEHPLQVMFKHCASPVPDPRERVPDLPADIATIIHRAMAKQPDNRYAGALEMQDDLQRLLAGAAPLPAPIRKSPRAAPSKSAWDRLHNVPRAWLAASAAAVLILVAGAAVWSQWGRPPRTVPSWPRPAAAATLVSAVPSGAAVAWRPGFRERPGDIRQCVLSRNGRYLACALGEGGGIVLDVEGDERTREIKCPDGPAHVRSVAFAADSEIAIAAVGPLVQAHEFTSGRFERLQSLKGQATSVAVSACGKYLAVGEDRGEGQSGRVWLHQIGESPAPDNVTNTREIEFPYTTPVCIVAFSPDSLQLVAGNEYGTLIVYDVAQALSVRMLYMPEPQRLGYYGRCVAYSPDSAWLASAGDRRVAMWNATTWEERLLGPVHQGPITHLVFTSDGRWLISAAADGLVRWDLATGEPTSPPVALNSPAEVRSLVFLGGDQWLLSGTADKRFLLWNWHEAFSLAAAREEVRKGEIRRREELRR